MRAILIILAIIGGLFVLTIAGCVGCTALVVSAAADRPAHHDSSAITARYGDAITAAEQQLAAGEIPTAPPLVAVVRVIEQDVGMDEHEVVHPPGASTTGHMLVNGAGTVWLSLPGGREGSFPTRQVGAGGSTWLLCFEDWTPEPTTEGAP